MNTHSNNSIKQAASVLNRPIYNIGMLEIVFIRFSSVDRDTWYDEVILAKVVGSEEWIEMLSLSVLLPM